MDFNEKELMQDTQNWPNWPILPVKNYKLVKPGELPECGIIFSQEVEAGKDVTVFVVNIFMLPADLSNVPQTKYESLDALLAAGWVGD